MRLISDNFLHCCLMRTTLLEIQAHKWQGQVGATAFMLLSMFCKAYASSTTTRTKCGILHPFWQRIEHKHGWKARSDFPGIFSREKVRLLPSKRRL